MDLILSGYRRVFHPTFTERLEEYDRGYHNVDTKPPMFGVVDILSVVAEGVDRTMYLPSSAVKKAFGDLGRRKLDGKVDMFSVKRSDKSSTKGSDDADRLHHVSSRFGYRWHHRYKFYHQYG